MSNFAGNLVIGDVHVSERDGMFSMSDIHRASGFGAAKRPDIFLRNKGTKSLIDELGEKKVVRLSGKQGGTWAVAELVCAYAMWVDAGFYLKVISTFMAVAKGDLHGAARLADTEASRAAGMRLAMSALGADRAAFSRKEKAVAALEAASACMDEDTLHKRIKTEVEIIISRCLPARRGISKNALVESVSGTGLFVLGSHVDERFVQVVMEDMEEAGLLQYDGPLVKAAG